MVVVVMVTTNISLTGLGIRTRTKPSKEEKEDKTNSFCGNYNNRWCHHFMLQPNSVLDINLKSFATGWIIGEEEIIVMTRTTKPTLHYG